MKVIIVIIFFICKHMGVVREGGQSSVTLLSVNKFEHDFSRGCVWMQNIYKKISFEYFLLHSSGGDSKRYPRYNWCEWKKKRKEGIFLVNIDSLTGGVGGIVVCRWNDWISSFFSMTDWKIAFHAMAFVVIKKNCFIKHY